MPITDLETKSPVSLGDIVAARARVRPFIQETPLMESTYLNELIGGRLFLKAENLQKAGSFKFRGACNRLLQLSNEEKKAGVVAWSSGNHALAVSAVGAMLDVPVTILMPSNAPKLFVGFSLW